MTSPILYEHYYSGAFLIREANGFLSRDVGVINNATASDLALDAGLVLSRNAPAAAAATPLGANAGNGAIGGIAVGGPIQAGAYVVVMESATTFVVQDPGGIEIGHGVAGVPFNAGGLAFTLTAGATAFAPGDSFSVNVAPYDGSYVPYTGAAAAAAILYNRLIVPAAGSRKVTLIVREAEVNVAELLWDPSVTAAPNAAALLASAQAALGSQSIVFRAAAPSAG